MIPDTLSLTFSALAHPVRRAILERLKMGPLSVQDLVLPFPITAPAVSRHLKVLEKCGLIERGRDAQFRPCRLEVKPLVEANSWIESYRREWEARFDRLDAYLQTLQSNETESKEKTKGNPEETK